MGYRLDDSRKGCVRDNDFIYTDLLQVPDFEKPTVQIDWCMSHAVHLVWFSTYFYAVTFKVGENNWLVVWLSGNALVAINKLLYTGSG